VAALVAAAIAMAALLRLQVLGCPSAVGAAAAAAGFAASTFKCAIIAHPVLTRPVWNVDIAGFVEMREARERSDRITVRVANISGPRLEESLERVRVSLRKGTAPAVGKFVQFKARLSPPLQPLRPGGYDFARDMYFQRIGASGFALGRIRTGEPPHPPSLGLRYAMLMDGMRETIDGRIRAVLPGERGAIASALITGKRDTLSAQLNEAMYVSGLAHVLSISGYHMAVVAGIVFFTIRALIALLPAFANRHPIKKWAAARVDHCRVLPAAVRGRGRDATLLHHDRHRPSGSPGRPPDPDLSQHHGRCHRGSSAGAGGNRSSQLSDVVCSDARPHCRLSAGAALDERGGDTPLAARIALWGGRELAGLLLVSLLAGTATIPYIAYHFHRISPFGMVGNLAAMPVISAWVMPWGIAGVFVMPLGLDRGCWQMMGWGIDWMTAVALWVTTFPGAVGRLAAFDAGALLLCTLGLVVLCLLRSPLRLLGAALMACATAMALGASQPDVLIASDASAVAVRGPEGRLRVMSSGTDNFAVREWLAADGDPRTAKDSTLALGINCDEAGCIGKLHDGALVALVKRIDAFEEDCRRAAIVISTREAAPECAALTVGRRAAQASGALALRRVGSHFEISAARPAGYDRPWARNRTTGAGHSMGESQANRPREGLDAMPRVDDLEPGD
jgi:competence protein ComEC